MIGRRLLILWFLFSFCSTAYPQPSSPDAEVRGVWITTAASLDWPRSYDVREQQAALRSMVRKLKAANFNTIFFQVRARGDAYYRSSFEPWAENLTGVLGKDPGYDPLQYMLDEAHRLGIEVHAWFNVYKVRGPSKVISTYPLHPAHRFAGSLVESEGEGWLDPGDPAVREYTVRVALEIVKKYEIDGLMFDFIRYPGRDFPDEEKYRRSGNGLGKNDWRRNNIDRFVTAIYDSAKQIKPMLKIGSAPIGIYDGDPNGDAQGAYHSYYQDSQGWLAKRKHDYLIPQIYWDIGSTKGDPDFATLAGKWVAGSWGRHVYTGIGAYKQNVLREIPTQIDVARSAGAMGQVYFRYENIESFNMLGGRYDRPAIIPAMTWKDSIPPNAPRSLAATEISVNIFHVEWLPPLPARDGDPIKSYALYRATSRHGGDRGLVAVIPPTATHATDTVATPSSLQYFYTLTAVDPAYNEGPPSNSAGAVVREAIVLKGRLARFTNLSTSLPHSPTSPALISYRLAERTAVRLTIENVDVTSSSMVLAMGIKEQGTYLVGLARNQFLPGRYRIKLSAGPASLEQTIDIH